jgi:hypothetical protein
MRNVLVAFGVLSGLVQLYAALWSDILVDQLLLLAALAAVAVAWGLWRAWPRSRISRDLGTPEVKVGIAVGDLFRQDAHLVVGFTDVFDTDMSTGEIIDPRSVQGQFQTRVYAGDTDRLDRDLAQELGEIPVQYTERPEDKPRGKRERYPIGTVAVLGDSSRRYFCVAYTEMQNNLVAKSSVDHLWHALSSLWRAVHEKGHRQTVAIPVIGTELARINCLDRESLLKMILLSFVAQSREEVVCRELIVVIHPKDYQRINILEVAAFLRQL